MKRKDLQVKQRHHKESSRKTSRIKSGSRGVSTEPKSLILNMLTIYSVAKLLTVHKQSRG